MSSHIKNFNNCCVDDDTDDCIAFLDTQFRIPRHLLATVVDNVNKEIFDLFQRIQPEDEQIDKNPNKKD